ncbi:MAG: glycosyltransferase family 4 protein [Gammaproteobacteria bacterium]
MKLLFIGWGEHMHVIRWMEQFALRGEKISVLNLSERVKYRFPVRQFRNPFVKQRLSVQQLWVRLVIALVRPRIIHVHWLHFLALVPASWKGPIVVTGWGSDLYQPHDLSPAQREALTHNIQRVDWFTVDSADQREVLMEQWNVPGDKVEVVQWGVDLETFSPGPPVEQREHIIYSCRAITPIYNQDVIMRAFAKVREKISDARLIIKKFRATDPPLSQVLALIEELHLQDSVEVLDSLPYEALPKLYQSAMVSVSIPTTDGTPMAVLETMSCGALPVFTDLPSLREWIVDGENGYLSDPKDVDMLADKLLQAFELDDQRKREITQNNLRLVRETADQKMHMNRVHDRYKALAARD